VTRIPMLYRLARRRRWNCAPDDSIRRRIWSLASDRHPWWDWGHRLMVVVGQDDGGNWAEPRMRTVWYREVAPVRMWRTRFPTHPPRSYQVIDSYSEFRALTDGIDKNSDAHYEWRAIGGSQDGDLHLGRQFWGGTFYGLNHWETELLRRHLNRWRLRNWFGLRSWLYSQALHAAVHRRKPFACQQVPPKGSGGYSHWHCQLPKRHAGPHQYNAARWNSSGLLRDEARP